MVQQKPDKENTSEADPALVAKGIRALNKRWQLAAQLKHLPGERHMRLFTETIRTVSAPKYQESATQLLKHLPEALKSLEEIGRNERSGCCADTKASDSVVGQPIRNRESQPAKDDSEKEAWHSDDYRRIRLHGEEWELTETQGKLVELLWSAREKGDGWIYQQRALKRAESKLSTLTQLFRDKYRPALEALIEIDKKHHRIRLKI